jgi:CO/xanthine dehydrogenase FAD-binding subunit
MIFQNFSYICPTSIQEAVALLSDNKFNSKPIAGGTDLVIGLRSGAVKVDRVVDVTHIPELKSIGKNGCISVGAAATFTEIVEHPLLQKEAPLLTRACQEIGSLQIRNLATIGGNVANAAICADSLPALVCLGANTVLQSGSGTTRIPTTDFVTGPGHVQLPASGLILSFEFEPLPPGYKFAIERIGRRKAMSISRLTLVVAGSTGPDGKINAIRVSPGAAFPQFRRVKEVEDILYGETPSEKLFVAAGQVMSKQYHLISGKRWSAEWKEKAIAAITERALRRVFRGTHEN